MWRQLNPLRNKIIFGLVCNAVLMLIFCIPLWQTWNGTILRARLDSLHLVAARSQTVFEKRGIAALATEIDDWVQNDYGAYGELYQLLAPDGRRLAGNVVAIAPVAPDAHGLFVTTVTVGRRHPPAELIRHALPGGYRLWIGREMTRYDNLEAIFVRGMIGTNLITLLFGLAAAWAGRRSTLDRMDMTNRTMAAIIDGDLSKRLHETHRGDEFDVLARTVNGMLAQLDVLVQNVKQSSNAIAHDLRTPLAELRADLEQLAVMRPPADALLAGIDLALADVDRVMAIFNALLRLAQIDSGTRRAAFKAVDVGLVLEEAAEFYAPVADDRHVRLSAATAPGLVVFGDAVLLAQATGNLLDNALKYGAGGPIALAARRNAHGAVEIEVADRGPGIPDAEKAKVTERFYRLDTGRSTPGVGLGLTLVSAVAHLHGGSFDLYDHAPGLRAVLTIPPVDARHATGGQA